MKSALSTHFPKKEILMSWEVHNDNWQAHHLNMISTELAQEEVDASAVAYAMYEFALNWEESEDNAYEFKVLLTQSLAALGKPAMIEITRNLLQVVTENTPLYKTLQIWCEQEANKEDLGSPSPL